MIPAQKSHTCVSIFFHRIAEEDEDNESLEGEEGAVVNGNAKKLLKRQSTIHETDPVKEYEGNKTELSGLKLVWQQFYALIVKRIIYTKRRYLLYGILSIVPALQCIIQQVSSKTIIHNSTSLNILKLSDTILHPRH